MIFIALSKERKKKLYLGIFDKFFQYLNTRIKQSLNKFKLSRNFAQTCMQNSNMCINTKVK